MGVSICLNFIGTNWITSLSLWPRRPQLRRGAPKKNQENKEKKNQNPQETKEQSFLKNRKDYSKNQKINRQQKKKKKKKKTPPKNKKINPKKKKKKKKKKS